MTLSIKAKLHKLNGQIDIIQQITIQSINAFIIQAYLEM